MEGIVPEEGLASWEEVVRVSVVTKGDALSLVRIVGTMGCNFLMSFCNNGIYY